MKFGSHHAVGVVLALLGVAALALMPNQQHVGTTLMGMGACVFFMKTYVFWLPLWRWAIFGIIAWPTYVFLSVYPFGYSLWGMIILPWWTGVVGVILLIISLWAPDRG
jgi:hypothetical protein